MGNARSNGVMSRGKLGKPHGGSEGTHKRSGELLEGSVVMGECCMIGKEYSINTYDMSGTHRAGHYRRNLLYFRCHYSGIQG